MQIRHIKNSLLIFLFSILFISCRGETNTKFAKIEKKNYSINDADSNSFKFADGLTFKALYDSSNKVLIPKLSRFSNDTNYSLFVDAANRIAANYRKLGNYDSAFSFVSKSIDVSDKHLDSVNLGAAQSFYLLGLMYRDFNKNEEAFKYLNKSLKIRKSILSANDPLIGDIYNNIGVVFYNKMNYVRALEYFRDALRLRKARGFYNKSVGSTYMNIGNIYADLNKYESSICYFDTAMTIQKKILGNNHPFIAMILLNQANSYDSMGLLDSAIASDKKALRIFKKTFGNYHPYIASLYNNLGLYHKSFGDYKNAISFYLKSIDVKKKLNANLGKEYLDNYVNLGESYRMLNNFKASINALQKALKIVESSKKINATRLSNVKSKLALTYLSAGNNSLAVKMELEAISELEQKTPNDSLEIFKIRIFLSQIFNKVGDLDKSILNSKNCINYFRNKNLSWAVFGYELLADAYLQKGEYLKILDVYDNFSLLFADSNNTDKLDVEKINSYSNINSMITETLSYIGQAYMALFKQTQKPIYLDKAENIYKLIMKLFSNNFENKVLESSKIKETEKVKIFIQTGLKAAYNNFVLKPTETHFEYALSLAEFGKSLTVLESLGEKSAFEASNIPNSIVEKITAVKKKIRYFTNQLSFVSEPNITVIKKKDLEDRLFEARLEYDELKNSLNKKYPVYKSLTQMETNLSLTKIKTKILDNSQSAVEYYLGKNELYAFIITKNNFFLLKKDLPENFSEDINKLLGAIKNNQFDNFTATARKIYKTTFADVDSLIATKRILIVNDGVLGYIPYDVLLYAEPNKNDNYKSLPFIIKKYSIGYAYSFNVLEKSKEGDNIVSKFLGIAPFSK